MEIEVGNGATTVECPAPLAIQARRIALELGVTVEAVVDLAMATSTYCDWVKLAERVADAHQSVSLDAEPETEPELLTVLVSPEGCTALRRSACNGMAVAIPIFACE